MLTDRRAFPRYSLEFPVSLSFAYSDRNQAYSSESINISRSSIEISCDGEVVKSIMDQAQYPLSCVLEFQLPGSKQTLSISSQVLTQRRISQHTYYIVMLFTKFNEGSADFLSDYLNEQQGDNL